MLYIKFYSTSMVSEAIGRFFPDRIAWSRDSKMRKTRQGPRDISISNTQNEKAEVFHGWVARTYVWPNFDAWRISGPSHSFLNKWPKDSLAIYNINENRTQEFQNNRPILSTYVFPISDESFWMMIWWRHRYDSSTLTSESGSLNPIMFMSIKKMVPKYTESWRVPIQQNQGF